MADIKVQRGSTTVSTDGTTATIGDAVGSLNDAFVVITGNRHVGAGSSTGNMEADDLSVQARLTGTNQITFDRPSTTPGIDQIVYWEVWEYTGAASGPNEFIVRDRREVDLTSTAAATEDLSSVSISNVDDCIPFINGVMTASTSNSANDMTITAYLDSSEDLNVEVGVNDSTAKSCHITTVEFTGSNWNVYHGRVTGQTADTGTITLRGGADGISGSSPTVDWDSTALMSWGHKGDSSNEAIADNWPRLTPNTTSSMTYTFNSGHDGSDDDICVHVLEHPSMLVYRFTGSEGTGSLLVNQNVTSAALTNLEKSSVVGCTMTSSGGGTAYARGWRSFHLSSLTNVENRCSRTGNNCNYEYQVINLSGVGPIGVSGVGTGGQIDLGATDITITGFGFEATKGTGSVEIGPNADYTGTKVTQTIDSWEDTSIQFDFVKGSLSEGANYLFVTNDSGDRSSGFPVNIGRPTYFSLLTSLGADHLWMLDNNYNDDIGSNPMTTDVVGGGQFVASPICRDNTHAWELNDVLDRRGCADSTNMNIGGAQQRRTMGGWIQLGTVQRSLACLYKEGAQINNACFLLGLGNALVAQVADTGDFTVQAYSDFLLAPDRPYHIMWQFEANTYGNFIKLFIDGEEQSRSSGAPNASDFDNHSGDINWGQPDTDLEMGGSDVAFSGSEDCLYAAWITFSTSDQATDSEIFDMFAEGALADDYIDADTVANMQSDIDALSTSRGDWPISIEIPSSTDGGDFTLTLTDFDFDDRISVHVIYTGSDELTIRKSGTTNLDSNKFVAVGVGSVAVIETAPVKVTVQDIVTKADIQGARVLILADSGGPLPAGDSISIVRSGTTATVTHTAHGLLTGDEVLIQGANQSEYNGIKVITVTGVNDYTFTVSGTPTTPATGTITSTAVVINGVTDSNGEIEAEIDYTSSQPITGRVRRATTGTRYRSQSVVGTVGANGFDGTVLMISDE